MSIYKMSKIVLALLLAGGCLTVTGAARAADETTKTTKYTFTPNGSSSTETAASVTVSVSTEQKTYTYTDANGTEQEIKYTTLTEATSGTTNPSVSVDVTKMSELTPSDTTQTSLSYTSPNITTSTAESDIQYKYYAWVWVDDTDADGNKLTTGSYVLTAVSSDGYILDATTGTATQSYAGINLTVSYVSDTTYGDGITNDGSDTSLSGSSISADFVADHHNEQAVQGGGAIFNNGREATVSLGTITGNFIGNYETNAVHVGATDNNNMEGGAITNFADTSNYTATIEAIVGNFVGNYVEVANDGSTENTITGLGGAISNYGNATIKRITGDFIGNHVEATQSGTATTEYPVVAMGGAISNYTYTSGGVSLMPTIEKIEGNFIGNYVESSGGAARGSTGGGAIATSGIIGQTDESGNLILTDESGIATVAIAGSFIGNYAKTTEGGYAYGGAIFNRSSSSKIGNIQADFIGNYAEATSSGAYGGAIYNAGSIADVGSSTTKSNFIGNYVKTSGSDFAQGGAIYNTGTFGDITADFIGNSAETSGTYALGGAINNNNGTINSLAGDFIGNSAKSEGENEETSYAWGGAIYNTGKIGYVDESDTTTPTAAITGNFISNTATSEANDSYGGAIYNNGTIGTLDTSNNVTVDGISGSTFIANTAARGGAIYNGTDKTTAESNGGDGGDTGGDAATGTTYTGIISSITNTQFIQNVATRYGGAIYNYADGAIYNIANNDFVLNEAQGGNGGAIENAEATSYIGTISGNNFAGNKVNETSHGGGAIYSEGIIDDLSNNVFVENESGTYGGAIYNHGGTIGTTDENGNVTGSISGNSFQGNTSGRGGAIYNTAREITDESSGEVTGYEEGTGNITSISGNYFVKNVATAYGGAIYNYHGASIGEIANNYFIENEADNGNGGAIENAESDAYIGSITGNVFSKNKVTQSDHGGGAIYNEGIIGELTDNTFDTNSSGNFGGAIYNHGGTIGTIGGTVTTSGNTTTYSSAFKGNTSERGGAIYNVATEIKDGDNVTGYTEGTGTIEKISGNYFQENIANYYGGAIYNYHGGTIGEISSNYFEANEAKGGNGGAVENAESDAAIGKMDSNTFVNNTATGNGGAIYNEGTIGSASYTNSEGTTEEVSGGISDSTFSGNSAQNGGAIYNAGSTTGNGGTIASITGSTFTSNSAKSTDGDAQGGAIYNAGTIGGIEITTLSGNTAEGATSAAGGAIYNAGTIGESGNGGTISVGLISQNYAKATGTDASATAQGGAIYNDDASTTINVTGSITDNYASATNGTAKGGAIYTTGDVNITAENGSTISITGNKANDDDNAIYMAKADGSESAGSVNFSLSGESKIYLYDNIQGETGYGVNISGDGLANVFYLLNDVEGSNLSVGAALTSPDSIKPLEEEPAGDSGDDSGDTETVTGNLTLSTTLHTLSDEAHTYTVNSFTVAGDFNMEADVDLATETMDHFETTDRNSSTVTDNSKLNVSDMNGLSDTDADKVAVYFAEEGLMENVTSSVSTVKAPVHEYSVAYIYKDDSGIHYADTTYDTADSALMSSKDNGGYFVFDKGGFNPAVMTPSVAAMGVYGLMSLMFDYNFEHSDYYMKLPEDVRLAMSEEGKNAKNAPKETDATRPEYYNQHELTYRGAWFKSFFSNEGIGYGGGWGSRDKYYGAMVGFDTDLKEHDNGWATVFSGYAGSAGIHQSFSGGRIKQLGGFIGATANFYKKNFYTAWTVAAGTMKARETTMYGKDSDRIDSYGIAGRVGWNFKLGDEGKFSLLPTFTASFTYVNPEDFTNAAGVKITGSGVRAAQLNPNVKLIWNRDDGWQPYLTLGEVWTVGDSVHLRANGEKLDELDLDPYTEYGIGVQKRWAYDRDAYVQVLGHSDGRDGILVNAGIRWNF